MNRAVCIISFSPIARDARVLRQIRFLGLRYNPTVIGFGDAHPAWDVRLSELALLTVAGHTRPSSHEHRYWRRPHHRGD